MPQQPHCSRARSRIRRAPATQRAYLSTHGFDTRIRHGRHRLRSRRPESRDRGGQAGQIGGRHRAASDARRSLRQHRHHPVEDAARGGALPDRDESARALRRQLPGQGQDHPGRPAVANQPRHRQTSRNGAQPTDAQPGRSDRRPGPVPRRAHPSRRRPFPWRTHHGQRRIHRHRDRHQTRAARRGGVRRAAGAGLRRHPRSPVDPGVDGGGRRRA